MAHQIVERPQRLLERRVAVPSMHLVKIDVIGLQPAETPLHFAHDVYAGRAAPVEILAHGETDFRGYDDLVSHSLQGVAHQNLTLPEAVHVRRIDEVDSALQGYLHHAGCVLLTKVAHVHPAAELHRAKTHLAHNEPSIPQFSIPHLPYSFHCKR